MSTALDDDDDFSDLDEFDDEPEAEDLYHLAQLDQVDEPEEEVLATTVTVSGNAEPIRRPLISGHCAHPGVVPEESHARCQRNGGFTRANPDKVFQPCPCRCHFPAEEYECECGATLVEAPHYPLDEDGDVRYVHLDPRTGRVTDGECPR